METTVVSKHYVRFKTLDLPRRTRQSHSNALKPDFRAAWHVCLCRNGHRTSSSTRLEHPRIESLAKQTK